MEFFSNIIEAFSFPELVSQDGGKVDGLVIAVHLLMLVLFLVLLLVLGWSWVPGPWCLVPGLVSDS